MRLTSLRRLILLLLGLALIAGADAGNEPPPQARLIPQGDAWTPAQRDVYAQIDQGSRLIPLAWLTALRQADGTPFLADHLARHGFLPGPMPSGGVGLPRGFSVAPTPDGPVAGLTCAACHTREIVAGGAQWRIEGGPAFIDFQGFLADLDGSVHRVLATDAAFAAFAGRALGASTTPSTVAALHDAVRLWSLRFHTWLGALPEQAWGPARLDAFSMIFNRLAVLDVGAPRSYLIPANVEKADAPARFPFLWTSPFQDKTDWAGFADNGNDRYALARNIGEVMGVFAIFHPHSSPAGAALDRDYLADTSVNFHGLAELESMVVALKPPRWPWPVDGALAARGKAVFDLSTERGGCVDCHGEHPGASRGPRPTFATPVLDVGTDSRMWDILQRSVQTGSMTGAALPGIAGPLRETDSAANLLKTSVIGMLIELDRAEPGAAAKPMHPEAVAGAVRMPGAGTGRNAYEARVLHGIWAAAPYLHNGSVPTLADLLKPAGSRPRRFAVGPVYDLAKVGLAETQEPGTFTLKTTDCADRDSGNSRCGHDFGTRLPNDDKRALLEYLKTL